MSSKVRIYEVAKQLNLDPKAVVGLFQSLGVTDVRNHMSSVDPDAVERVKRHLEKQRTHDVVEERIRPTVLKRRAVAKKPKAASSAPASAAAPPPASSAQMNDVASRRDLSAQMQSEPAKMDVLARDRESARLVREASEQAIEAAPPSAPSAPAAPPSSVAVIPAAPPSAAAPSVKDVSADRASARDMQAAPSVAEVAPPSAPSVPSAPSAPAVVEAAPPSVPEVSPEPVAAAAPEPTPEPAPEPTPAPPRVSSPPKTGVEYWTGRPGVPMPTPVGASRTAIGGGATGAMARRVQYDPRAGSGPARGGLRPGQTMRGGPMGRGGSFGRGRHHVGAGGAPRRPPAVSTQEMSAHKKVIRIEENITLSSMAAKLSLKATELLMKLISMGTTGVHINTTLDADTAKILANEFGWEVEDVALSEDDVIAAARGEDAGVTEEDEALEERAPVVTVMGHVDHGKTSLLDKIRRASVASGEAGGITQHIGAYKVKTEGGPLVFLDTPGHEAFTQMRARGASVTDLVILVVAADDGVMPQTKEAIAHARAAKVPIIVAVNKIDKPNADLERARRELVENGLQPEDWGGDTIVVPVSAHTGEGIPQLLDMVHLQSEMLELRANPNKPAAGTVIEALLDRGRGPVARVLVQDGTLRVGDFVLAGPGFGKVRAMTNEHGKNIQAAGPSTPVEILGLSDVPGAGDPVDVVLDPKKAQEIADSRKSRRDTSMMRADARISLDALAEKISQSDQQELRVIIKGDVQGSLEALSHAFQKLSTDRVRLSVVHAAVGAITEGDINLAIASKAIVIGFNVRPAGKASALADENKIEIRLYSIIYDAVDDVKRAMEGLLPATLVEKSHGKAEVRQVFKIRGLMVAGSYVIEGKVYRNDNARLIRDGAVIWDGKMFALKRFKDDVKDVAEGFECGITLDGFSELKEKDIIESYEVEEVKQTL